MGLCKCIENGKVTVSQHLVLRGYVTPYVIAPHVCEHLYVIKIQQPKNLDSMSRKFWSHKIVLGYWDEGHVRKGEFWIRSHELRLGLWDARRVHTGRFCMLGHARALVYNFRQKRLVHLLERATFYLDRIFFIYKTNPISTLTLSWFVMAKVRFFR